MTTTDSTPPAGSPAGTATGSAAGHPGHGAHVSEVPPGAHAAGWRNWRGRPWPTLVAAVLGVLMVGLDGTVVSIANPYIARDLGASLSGLQWVTNAYLLTLAVTLILAGKLGDRFGRRSTYLIGVIGFAVTSLAVGLSGTIALVVLFRTLQGLAGALIMPNALALLREAFPADKLNSAMGIYGAVTAMAVAGGPILAGVLVEHINWESVFYINVPVGALALIGGLFVLRESKAARTSFDFPGVIALAGALFLIIFGVIKAQTWGWTDARTLGFLAAGVVVGVIFVFVERAVSSPLLPLEIFRDRSVSISTVAVLINFFALVGILFFVSLYLQSVHGYDAVGAGVRTLPLTLVFVVSSPLGGWLTGRFGPRVPIFIGLVVVAVAMVGLTQLQTDSAYVVLWPPLAGMGVGIGLVIVAATDAIVGNTPVELAGVAGGLQTTAVQLGGVLGSSILGSVLASRVGSTLVDSLTGAGVPASQASGFLSAKDVVAQGVAPVPKGASPSLAAAITDGAHASFMSGLHVAVVVAAVIAAVGAAMAPFIRRGESPREGVPVA